MKNSQKGFILPFLIILVAILTIGSGVYIYQQNTSKVTPIQTTNSASPTPVVPPIAATTPSGCTFAQQVSKKIDVTTKNNISTYTNDDYDFKISYPSGLVASSTFRGGYFVSSDWRQDSNCGQSDQGLLSGQQILSLIVNSIDKRDSGEDSNKYFYTSELTIGASNSTSEVAHCFDSSNDIVDASSTQNINGVTFQKYELSPRAGMSQFASVTSYRTIHNNTCFVLEAIQSGGSLSITNSLQNVMEADAKKMDSIISNFTFTK